MPSDHPDAPSALPAPPLPVAGDAVALDVDAAAGEPRSPALLRAGLLVGAATMLANALGYAFTAVVARGLGPRDYGAVAALLAVLLIASVPALALQAVTARRVAVAGPGPVPGLLRVGVLLGAAVAATVAAAAPLLADYLRLETSAALWLAVGLWPLTVVHGVQGVLQGRERFAALGVVFVLVAGSRLVGGGAALLARGGVEAVMAGTAAGALVAALVGWGLVGRGRTGAGREEGAGRELATAAAGLLGLVVLSNVDVLLARRHLPARESGLYAVGAVFTKVALWAPQAVVVLAFPRLAAARSSGVLRTALLAVGGCGAVLVLGAAVAGPLLVRLVFGSAYADLGDVAWVFAALGAALAVAQVLVFQGIAARTSRLALLVAAAVVVEVSVVVTVRHDSVLDVVGTALACAVALCVVGTVLARSRPVAPDHPRGTGAGAEQCRLHHDRNTRGEP